MYHGTLQQQVEEKWHHSDITQNRPSKIGKGQDENLSWRPTATLNELQEYLATKYWSLLGSDNNLLYSPDIWGLVKVARQKPFLMGKNHPSLPRSHQSMWQNMAWCDEPKAELSEHNSKRYVWHKNKAAVSGYRATSLQQGLKSREIERERIMDLFWGIKLQISVIQLKKNFFINCTWRDLERFLHGTVE